MYNEKRTVFEDNGHVKNFPGFGGGHLTVVPEGADPEGSFYKTKVNAYRGIGNYKTHGTI